MINLFNIIKSHPLLTLLCIVVAFFIPLVIVQLLFSFDSGVSLLQAKWNAGDLLAYLVGFLTIISTTFLSMVALYQSERASLESENRENENLYINKLMAQKLYPVIGIKNFTSYTTSNSLIRLTQIPASQKFQVINAYSEDHPQESYTELIINIDVCDGQKCFLKELDFELYNNSEAVIRHIAIDAVQISGYQGLFSSIPILSNCKGSGISSLLNQDNATKVKAKFYFQNEKIKASWEDFLGGIAFTLFVTNRTITGLEFNEYVSIRVSGGGHADISYGDKAFEDIGH